VLLAILLSKLDALWLALVLGILVGTSSDCCFDLLTTLTIFL